MSYIEVADKLLVNKDRKEVKVPVFTQETVDQFRRLIAACKSAQNMFDVVEDADAFLNAYGSVKEAFGYKLAVELFYASKLKFFYPGVPCKLSYILNKMVVSYGVVHVNDSLCRASKLLSSFVSDAYESNGTSVTVKDVIENFVGSPVKLLTSSVRKVKAADCYEVYVPNVDRVALLPNDIANTLPYSECAKIEFDKECGLVIGDVLLRTMNGRIGVVKNDFDLRDCI